jgi:hypothetical protein
MNRKNLPLIVAISLPFVMIAILAAVVYLPGISAKPQYNFIYVSGGGYYGPEYTVEQGKLVKHDISAPTSTDAMGYPRPKYPEEQQVEETLFMHDVKTNVSTRISYEDAAKLSLSNEIISPDGYQIQENYGNGGFMPFFFGGGHDYNTKYLVGHRSAEKLNITGVSTTPYSYNPYRFIGWVLQ